MSLPLRAGPRPRVNQAMPHTQLDQSAPSVLQETLFARVAALPHVVVGRSHVSVPGARAFHLDPAHANGPRDAFMAGTEFAHLHPPRDGSLHALLPPALVEEALAKGWAEHHPVASMGGPQHLVMLYGPRDAEELEVVWTLLQACHARALGPA